MPPSAAIPTLHFSAQTSIPYPDSLVPEPTQRFLQTFFKFLDDETAEGAKAWSELFTVDAGYYVLGSSEFHGRQALEEQRIWAWKTWPGMAHSIKGIYAADKEGLDVVVIGGYEIEVNGGKLVAGGSAANYHLTRQSGGLLIQRLEVFSDPKPLTELIPGP